MKGREKGKKKGMGAKIISLVLAIGVFLVSGPVSSFATDLQKAEKTKTSSVTIIAGKGKDIGIGGKYSQVGRNAVTKDVSILNENDTSYDLWVGGIKFTDSNTVIDSGDITGVTGSATYEATTKTLTLDNFTYAGAGYTVSDNSAVIYSEIQGNLTIDLKNNNTITQNGGNGSYGIYSTVEGVKFKGNGSIDIKAGTRAFNQAPVMDTAFAKGKCWYGESQQTADNAGIKQLQDLATAYVQKFVRIASVSTVSFHANGGQGTQTDQIFIGTIPQNLKMNLFTNMGYKFKAWNTKADGSGTSYNDGQSITVGSDMILYAQWEKAESLDPSDTSVVGVKVKDVAGTISGNTVTAVLPYGSDLSVLKATDFTITTANPNTKVTSQPATNDSGKTWNFTVTSPNNSTRTYTINLSVAANPEAQIMADLAAAKAAIEGRTWSVEQTKANTTSLVRTWVDGILKTLNLKGATCSELNVFNLSGARAGDATNTAGTAGKFHFTVKLTKGNSSVTASVTSGKITPTAYTGTKFVAVTDITGVPTEATMKKNLTLSATVQPSGATNKTIKWSIKNKGTTGASLSGTTLSTTATGNVILTATIENGKANGQSFTKDFTIKVKAAEAVDPAITGVTISPASATVERGKTVQFAATVKGTGTFKKEVTWSIAGQKGNSSINASGVLTIGSNESSKTITVKATSVGNTTKSATVTVTVSNPIDANHQHNFGPWKVTKDSTTTAEGTQQRTCSVCGQVENAAVAKKAVAASVPKTADSNKIGLWAALMVISLSGVGAALYLWKKEDMK